MPPAWGSAGVGAFEDVILGWWSLGGHGADYCVAIPGGRRGAAYLALPYEMPAAFGGVGAWVDGSSAGFYC